MPHTIPSNTSPNTTLTPAPQGPPEKISYYCTAASWNHPSKESTSPRPSPKTTPEDLRRTGNSWTAFRLPSHERSNTNRALLQVYIKSVTGRTISIRIPNENAKIGTLKDLIWSQEGIPPHAYYLSANARKLDNNSKVATIGKNPPYFLAMKFGLKGGSCLQRNERDVCYPNDYLALWNKQRQDLPVGTNKPCGQKGQGGIQLWLPHFTLMWTTLCTLLLAGLWVSLNVDNGLAAGITDKDKTEKAKTNCLWVAAIYSIGGIMASIHIVNRNHECWKRRNPRTQQQCSWVDQTQIQNISSPPQRPRLERATKRWTTTSEEEVRPKRCLIICVEGNIGSGKSTLLNGLKDKGWNTFQEPVEGRWKSLLKAFYREPSLWAFSFQIAVLEWFKWLDDNALSIPQSSSSGLGEMEGGGQHTGADTPHTRHIR